jgi:hypothetical protein
VLGHRFASLRYGVGVLAALGLLQASAYAAPQSTTSAAYGRWTERDIKLDFEVRPAANPNQLVLVIPKDVTFPGSHEFLLAKAADGSFESHERDRPKVSLSVKSGTEAKLKVRGHGATDRGTWIAMNDYTLVRR